MRRLRGDLDARSGPSKSRYPFDSAPNVREQVPKRGEPPRGNGHAPAGQPDQDRPANGRKSVESAQDRVSADAHREIPDVDIADAREGTCELRPELTRRSAQATSNDHGVGELVDPEVLRGDSTGLKMVLY